MPALGPTSRALCSSAAILLSLGFAVAANAQAATTASQPATVRAGRLNFVLPSPTPDLVEMGPDLRVIAETLAPATNRMIAAYIPAEDLAALPAGNGKTFDKYALIEVLRPAEFNDVSDELFKSIVDATGKQLDGPALSETTKKTQDILSNRVKELGLRSDVALEKIAPLGQIFSKTNAAGFAMMLPFAVKEKTVNMACGLIVLRVHNRLLYAYLYARYTDQASVNWIASTGEAWADAILKANAD